MINKIIPLFIWLKFCIFVYYLFKNKQYGNYYRIYCTSCNAWYFNYCLSDLQTKINYLLINMVFFNHLLYLLLKTFV